jgi:hypothetical protein
MNLKRWAIYIVVAWLILWLNSQIGGFSAQIPLLGEFTFAGISAGSAVILALILYFLRKWTP